jgi:hypothetical protein
MGPVWLLTAGFWNRFISKSHDASFCQHNMSLFAFKTPARHHNSPAIAGAMANNFQKM